MSVPSVIALFRPANARSEWIELPVPVTSSWREKS